jgi:hypothetical protein
MKSKLIIALLFFSLLSCKKAEAEAEVSADMAITAVKLPAKLEATNSEA